MAAGKTKRPHPMDWIGQGQKVSFADAHLHYTENGGICKNGNKQHHQAGGRCAERRETF